MMDPTHLFPEGFHPVRFHRHPHNLRRAAPTRSRSDVPVKYYFIDFGISRKYDADNTSPREWPIWGGDKTVPEFQESDDEQDPFPTDICYLGNMVREYFFEVGHIGYTLRHSTDLETRRKLVLWTSWSR